MKRLITLMAVFSIFLMVGYSYAVDLTFSWDKYATDAADSNHADGFRLYMDTFESGPIVDNIDANATSINYTLADDQNSHNFWMTPYKGNKEGLMTEVLEYYPVLNSDPTPPTNPPTVMNGFKIEINVTPIK